MQVRELALVSVSAGALITLVAGTALGLDRRVEAWVTTAIADRPTPPLTPEEDLRPLPIRPGPVAGGAATEAAPAPEPPSTVDRAVVPDLDGLRVGEARRLMRERGLRLVVRDDDGFAIAPEDGARYRIRGDALEPAAGTPIEPGGTVRARARDPRPMMFSGY